MVKRRPQILVVEDDPYWFAKYREWLQEDHGDVECVDNKEEAVEKIRCKTYNVAIVDIMLREIESDRGGVEVIRYLTELNEGTGIIVASGTGDIHVAIDTYNMGILGFIHKAHLRGSLDVVPQVEHALNEVTLKNVGRFGSLSAYLASPQVAPDWENEIFHALECGYDAIGTIRSTLNQYFPILRVKGSQFTLRCHHKEKAIAGKFWSKGLGAPIWVSIRGKGGTHVEPDPALGGSEVSQITEKKLHGCVWRLSNGQRDEFQESIWD
jgi:ActR/RegA family two-component response regulator